MTHECSTSRFWSILGSYHCNQKWLALFSKYPIVWALLESFWNDHLKNYSRQMSQLTTKIDFQTKFHTNCSIFGKNWAFCHQNKTQAFYFYTSLIRFHPLFHTFVCLKNDSNALSETRISLKFEFPNWISFVSIFANSRATENPLLWILHASSLIRMFKICNHSYTSCPILNLIN